MHDLVDLSGDEVDTITVEVGAHDLSVLVSAYGLDPDGDVAVLTVEDPDGQVVYEAD